MKIKTTVGSVITSLGIFLLLSWNVSQLIIRYTDNNFFIYFPFIIALILGGYIGISKPVFGEIFTYSLSVLIMIQFWWDFGAFDLNKWRWAMFISSLLLFIFNLFTGYIRIGGGTKIVKKQLGM